MANKKNFKKSVNIVCNGLVNDMMMAYYSVKEADMEKIDNAIVMVLTSAEKAVVMTNVKFDKTAKAFADKKSYNTAKAKFFATVYNKAKEEFRKGLNDALKVYNEAFPAEVRNELKEEVSK